MKSDVDLGGRPPPGGHQTGASTSLLRRIRILLLAGGPANTAVENLLFVLGAAAVAGSAIIHLHLWLNEGYSDIHTIGPLFLAQSIAGLVIAVAVVLFRRLGAALVGLGYLLGTIAGFLWSVNFGLFGFQDIWAAPFAKTAFWTETIGAILLFALFVLTVVRALRELAHRRL